MIAASHRRHRAEEFLQFLQARSTPPCPDLDVHLILDNYATHKTPAIKQVAAAPPPLPPALHADRLVWLNLVERWFAELTNRKLRRGSPPQRRRAGDRHPHLDRRWNDDPRPFVWTKTADEILETPRRISVSELPTQDTSRTSAATWLAWPNFSGGANGWLRLAAYSPRPARWNAVPAYSRFWLARTAVPRASPPGACASRRGSSA